MDEFDCKGSVNVLTFSNADNAFHGLLCQVRGFEGVQQVGVELFGSFEMVENAVDEHEGSC